MPTDIFDLSCAPCCSCCEGEPPDNFYVHGLEGIANGTCSDCDDYNVSTLELTKTEGECEWTAVGFSGSGGCGDTPTLTVNSDGSATLLIGGATYSIAAFDCDDSNDFTLDDAGELCDDWPETLIVSPSSGEEGCAHCTFGIAAGKYLVTIAGATGLASGSANCDDCSGANGSFEIGTGVSDDCGWRGTFVDVLHECSGTGVLVPDLSMEIIAGFSAAGWFVQILANASDNGAHYEEATPAPNCLQKRTLTKTAQFDFCTWPDTITIEPAA